MNFNDYTKKVIERYGLRGQNAVARELNITTASMSNFMSGKIVPSEETMLKLAELAGCPKEEALIDLNLWRSRNDPKRHEVWLRISKMIGCFTANLLFFSNFTVELISYICLHNVYYVYKRHRFGLIFR